MRGRGLPPPDYFDTILVAKWLGITPWEYEQAPIHWARRIEIMIAAMAEADKAKS